jgi:DNA-binding GntR family transcriptional regulator
MESGVPLGILPDQPLASSVTERLRAAIHTAELPPGARLVERVIAESLGVSHIPVREAIAQLANEGLVERLPRRGARVALLDEHQLAEIASLRTVLEQFVVQRVQDRWTSEVEESLRQAAEDMIAAARARATRELFDLDKHFHELLWQEADHSVLMSTTAVLRSRINGVLWLANTSLEPAQQLQHARTHIYLLDEIASGDTQRGCAAMAEHIQLSAERVAAMLRVAGPDGLSELAEMGAGPS